MACDTRKINKCTQKNHPKTSTSDNTSERLKLRVSTELLGPVTLKAIGGYSYIAKYIDHHTRLKAVYFVEKKSDTLHTLCKFVQDLAIPPGLRVQHLRSDNGGEYISSSFRDYCKNYRHTAAIHGSIHATAKSERDGRIVTDMTRCLLNEADLPKHLWGELAATAVFPLSFLLHHK